MKEALIEILTSHYFWIAIEAVVIAILLYFVVKYSRLNKAMKQEQEQQDRQSRYRELDDMLVNDRSKR